MSQLVDAYRVMRTSTHLSKWESFKYAVRYVRLKAKEESLEDFEATRVAFVDMDHDENTIDVSTIIYASCICHSDVREIVNILFYIKNAPYSNSTAHTWSRTILEFVVNYIAQKDLEGPDEIMRSALEDWYSSGNYYDHYGI